MPSSACSASSRFYSLSLHDALPIFVGSCDLLRFASVGEKHVNVWKHFVDSIPCVIGVVIGIERDCQSSRFQAPEQFRHAWLQSTLQDRKSTRLNSSHVAISYAVFCLFGVIPLLLSFPTRRSSDLRRFL